VTCLRLCKADAALPAGEESHPKAGRAVPVNDAHPASPGLAPVHVLPPRSVPAARSAQAVLGPAVHPARRPRLVPPVPVAKDAA